MLLEKNMLRSGHLLDRLACATMESVHSLPHIEPTPLVRRPAPFSHPDWLFELKYDGFRALAYVDRDSARLVSRNGNTFTTFSDLCENLRRAVPHQAVLDGEIACLDGQGRSQIQPAILPAWRSALLRLRSPVARWT